MGAKTETWLEHWGGVDQAARWDVTVACHGATHPRRVVWPKMPGDYAWEAIEAVFSEHDWPESWECLASESFRLTVTVVPSSAASSRNDSTKEGS